MAITAEQFAAIRETFPWRREITPGVPFTSVRMVNRFGQEVSLFHMLDILELSTTRMAPETPKETT